MNYLCYNIVLLLKKHWSNITQLTYFENMKHSSFRIKQQIEEESSQGKNTGSYSSSEVVVQVTDTLDQLKTSA